MKKLKPGDELSPPHDWHFVQNRLVKADRSNWRAVVGKHASTRKVDQIFPTGVTATTRNGSWRRSPAGPIDDCVIIAIRRFTLPFCGRVGLSGPERASPAANASAPRATRRYRLSLVNPSFNAQPHRRRLTLLWHYLTAQSSPALEIEFDLRYPLGFCPR